MDKQELIKHFEEMEYVSIVQMGKKAFIDMIEQLDEPQKVTVPQFVADWIDNVKRNGLKQKNNFGFFEEITSDSSAYTVMYHIFKEGIATKNIRNWVSDNTDEFARAWLDGYEVEKEKRYLVKAKEVYFNSCLVFEKKNKKWFFSSIYEIDHQRGYHTRKELEDAGFGWVFDCPGMEVEEVTE